MRFRRGVQGFTLLAVALLLGCQQSPPSDSITTPASAPTSRQLKDQGDVLVARGDYVAAATKYEAAVDQDPADVSLRFALGTALSHMNRREGTAKEFRFVLEHGRPDSPEVQAARRWLVRAGELAPTATFSPSANEEPAGTPAPTSITSSPPTGKDQGAEKD